MQHKTDLETVINAMQAAVDVVNSSEHNKNKIAASVFTKKNCISQVNQRPFALQEKLPVDVRLGKSSQFVHSEIACLQHFEEKTEGASICITDPCCPNCAKGIIESGIKHVYIDHKGMDKEFINRRKDEFEQLSLFMMQKAQISVSVVYRKENRIEAIYTPENVSFGNDSGIDFFDIAPELSLPDLVHHFRNSQPHELWACAKIRNDNGSISAIRVYESLPIGLSTQDFEERKNFSEKYGLSIDPVNRLYFYLKRKNIKLLNGHIGSNLHPSSRALVNSIGFGVTDITIGNDSSKKRTNRHDAAKILEENGILSLNRLY